MEDFSRHYIQNDARRPLPVSGPRVTVGYWAVAPAEIPEGTRPRPELFSPQPVFTIVYPVGQDGCYGWSHFTGNEADPLHPNSARDIEWNGGHLELTQFTEFDCVPSAVTGPTGKFKRAFWELFQDWPPELWGRIVAAQEITAVTPRESCAIRLRAGDGHFVGLDRDGEEGEVVCGSTLVTADCDFVARFPGYVWDREGGTGDAGAFALQASNGKFVRCTDQSGGSPLRADAAALADAALFDATIVDGCLLALAVAGPDGPRWLRHDSPGSRLSLTEDLEDPFTYFNASYV